jgi:predicted SprT family Zn-dependent metalloprotease
MELKTTQELAESLMKLHGLRNWRFEFDSAKRRFGCCSYGDKTISLSRHLVLINSYESVKDTILHEIAHALTPGHHHDNVWKRKAIEIGCNGERCYSSEDTNTIEGKYIAVCPGCNQTHRRFRVSRYNTSCGRCSKGTYNENYKLVFVQNKEASGN